MLASKPGCATYQECATFNAVWATGPNDVWIVGESGGGWGGSAWAAIQHWDGQTLTVALEYGPRETRTQTKTVSMLRGVFGFADAVYTHDGEQLLRLQL